MSFKEKDGLFDFNRRDELLKKYKKVYSFLKPISFIPNKINTEIYIIDEMGTWIEDKVYIRKGTHHIHNMNEAVGFIYKTEIYRIKERWLFKKAINKYSKINQIMPILILAGSMVIIEII